MFSFRTRKDFNAMPYERDAEPQPHKKLRRTLIKDLRRSQLESSWIVGRDRVADEGVRDDSRQDAGATNI
jgi:hypothetical protein